MNDFKKKYEEARELARAQDIKWEGVEVADIEYRIGSKLLTV